MKENRTLITAHSGADSTPENSIEFVKYALTIGADVLEIDVRMGEKNNLVTSHDQAGNDALMLQEVFETIKPVSSARINCDLKEYGLEEAVFCLARTCGLQEERLIYSGSVKPVKKEQPCSWREAEIYWNVEECLPGVYECSEGEEKERITEQMTEELVEACESFGISVVNINEKFLKAAIVEQMYQNGIGISAWTVNEENRIMGLLDLGVCNITSRKPRLALALREKKEKEIL